MTERNDAEPENGFSLAEVLIVMLLMSFVGGIVSTGLIQSTRLTRQNQARVVASAALQKTVERIVRDVTVADPPSLTTSSVVLTSTATDLKLNEYRSGKCYQQRYYVSSNILYSTTTPYSVTPTTADDCAGTLGTTSAATVLLTGIPSGSTLFTYFDSAGAATTTPASIARVVISVPQTLPENRGTVSYQAAAEIRNRP